MLTIEIRELTKCMDQKTGYMHFMKNYFHIQHPVRGKLLFDPFSYQEELLKTFHNYSHSVNMLPRQTGKTTCAAGYLLWYGMYMPNQNIVVASHNLTAAYEIMDRVRYAYEMCPSYIRAGVVEYTKTSIEFINGSRIDAKSATSTLGHGQSISLLYCDEFAYMPSAVNTALPLPVTTTRVIITSTRKLETDTFDNLHRAASTNVDSKTGLGVNGYRAFSSHWSEHPDFDDEWAAEMKLCIGEGQFNAEYAGDFSPAQAFQYGP
jgi:hypothetical protein